MGEQRPAPLPAPDDDPRRRIPRTDAVMASPEVSAFADRLGPQRVKQAVMAAQAAARAGDITPDQVVPRVADALDSLVAAPTTLTRVLNATGVVVHTNLGRAPLTPAAQEAMAAAAAYVDVEFDLATGARATRGRGTLAALRAAVPQAGAALVLNNGAAALSLAVTCLAQGREVVVSRGEMVEIGDGFRLPDLIRSTGVTIREVGTTNRTHAADYAEAIGPETGAIVKIHPSNFLVAGFTASVSVRECAAIAAEHGVPLVVDIGSGLLAPDSVLPAEPDAASTLADGADLVTSSGDKLLGGPQAGIVLGRSDLVERLRRHPLARAFRTDKVTLAALEATLRGPRAVVLDYLHADPDLLRARTERLAAQVAERTAPGGHEARDGVLAEVVAVRGAVGGGGGPGVPLPGWALSLPEPVADALRHGDPPVVARVEGGRTLVDLRCVPPGEDGTLAACLAAVLGTMLGAEPAES